MTTEQEIRNALAQSKCGGHGRIRIEQYREHVEELLRIIDELRELNQWEHDRKAGESAIRG